MSPLSKSVSAAGDRVRSRTKGLADAVTAVIDRVRPAPEPPAERAKREAREFLQQRREALAKAFDARMR